MRFWSGTASNLMRNICGDNLSDAADAAQGMKSPRPWPPYRSNHGYNRTPLRGWETQTVPSDKSKLFIPSKTEGLHSDAVTRRKNIKNRWPCNKVCPSGWKPNRPKQRQETPEKF